MTVLRKLLTLAAGVTVLSAASAMAATATGTLTVTALVNNSCTIGNATLDFGTYLTATGSTAAASVNVTCTLGTTYTLAIGQGLHYDSVGATNRLKANNKGMYYIPYSAAFTAPTLVGSGVAIPTAITGTAAAGANVPGDTYADSVIMTVTY